MAHSLACTSRSNACLLSTRSARIACSIPTFLAPSAATRLLNRRIYLQFPHSQPLHIRHASSTSTSPTSKSPQPALRDQINPPASTRPPPLQTPVRAPDQSTPSYLFALGKSYLSFYKTGLKAVWNNHKAAQAIRAQKLQNGSLKADEALKGGQLTRSEWHLLRRSAADVRKIPVFGLVLLICGEFTPFVVLALSGIVPRTCRIPRQVRKERESLEARRRESFRRGDSVVSEKEVEEGRLMKSKDSAEIVKELRWEQLLHISRALGLYAKLWDTLWDYPPQGILKRRVQERLTYLQLDDNAIVRYGGVKQLEPEEAQIAAEERGLDIVGRSDEDVQNLLTGWFMAKKQQSIPYLVLTRPTVWKI